jgi:hypothetical protein
MSNPSPQPPTPPAAAAPPIAPPSPNVLALARALARLMAADQDQPQALGSSRMLCHTDTNCDRLQRTIP